MKDWWIVSRQDPDTSEKVYWTRDETWSRDRRRATRIPLEDAAEILGANRGILCGGFAPAKVERHQRA